MHFCQDELNQLINSLPLLEHVTLYVRITWRWMVGFDRRAPPAPAPDNVIELQKETT
jgi:hypothetical protein